MTLSPGAPFGEVLSAAIEEFATKGYVNQHRLDYWVNELRRTAERDLGPEYLIDETVRAGFERLFERFVNGVKLPDVVEGVGRFTREMVKPKLYGELDRRINAAADLIKLNRREAIEKTLKRFTGWATAIPPGGDTTIAKRDTSSMLRKELRDYNYHKRFVDADQGHKLVANVSALIAHEAGAVAAKWNSHGAHDALYNARKAHLDRDGKIYLIRGSWAHRDGLVKPLPGVGYADDETAPGSEVNCRCWFTYITSPRRLPDEMLTKAGQEWITAGKARMAV